MRTTLAASMLNAISRNEKQGTLEGRLFEVASIYIPESLPLTSYPDERKVLCVGTFGNNESFFTMKASPTPSPRAWTLSSPTSRFRNPSCIRIRQ